MLEILTVIAVLHGVQNAGHIAQAAVGPDTGARRVLCLVRPHRCPKSRLALTVSPFPKHRPADLGRDAEGQKWEQ